MEFKFKRKISKISGVYGISLPISLRGSIEQGRQYKVSLDNNISFIRQASNLGGVIGFSIPVNKKGSIDLDKVYDVVLETGTVKVVLWH